MASLSSSSFVASRLGIHQLDHDLNLKGSGQRRVLPRSKKGVLAVSSVLDKSKLNSYRDPKVWKIQDKDVRNFDLRFLETDVPAAVEALKRKEGELRASERALESERRELKRLQNDLIRREEKIACVLELQEKLEEEIRVSREKYDGMACELHDVKDALKEREEEVLSAQKVLEGRDREVEVLRGELKRRDGQVSMAELEIRGRDQDLEEANMVIERQEGEIEQLKMVLSERERDLENSRKRTEEEEENFRIVENGLEKRWVAWIVAHQKMKELVHEVCKYQGRALVAEEDLESVRSGISGLKEELLCSKREIEVCKRRLAEKQRQNEKQQEELFVQKKALVCYEQRLRDAYLQVENEKNKVRVTEEKIRALEQDLNRERRVVKDLSALVEMEGTQLQDAVEEMGVLKKQVEKRACELAEAQSILGIKESELVAVRLEMRKLKAELGSMQVILKDKGSELDSAQKYIEELHEEISGLKALLGIREDELVKAANLIYEKEKKMGVIQLDLDNNKMRLSQAASMVENITELTNSLVGSAKDVDDVVGIDEDSLLIQTNYELFAARQKLHERELEIQNLKAKSEEDMKRQREKEAEVESLRGLLKDKEKELLDAHRALAVRDEELKALLNGWESREKDIIDMRDEVMEEANALNSLYASVQNQIGDKTLGELAVEKLELEAAKLDIEAAMHALRNIVDLSDEFIKETDDELSSIQSLDSVSVEDSLMERDVALENTRNALTHLNEMTKQLIIEATKVKSPTTQDKGRSESNENMAGKELKKLVMAAAA